MTSPIAHTASLLAAGAGFALVAPNWPTYLLGVALMAVAHYLAVRYTPNRRKPPE